MTASLLLIAAASLCYKVLPSRSSLSYNSVTRRSPLGWTVAFICIVTLFGMGSGLAPIFGALIAGMAGGQRRRHHPSPPQPTFIPIYFALIGVSLDLIEDFDPRFTLGLLVGTAVKFTASLIGARIAGEAPPMHEHSRSA